MSGSNAYGFNGGALALRQDIAVRIRDFLERKARDLGADRTRAALESALRSVEKAISSGLSFEAVRERVLAARRWLTREHATSTTDPRDLELAELFDRIHAFGKEQTVESWSAYVVTIDLEI